MPSCRRAPVTLSSSSSSSSSNLAVSPSLREFMSDNGRPLPKFGEWDVNDPASAEGFTVIFNKVRDEKKTGGNTRGSDSPSKEFPTDKQGAYLTTKPNSKKWFCCFQSSPAES